MLSVNFELKNYGWAVTILYECDCSNVIQIQNRLCLMGCTDIPQVLNNLLQCVPNTGIAYTNYRTQSSLIVINKCTTVEELVNTASHEFYHLVQQLALPWEEGAVLMGELCASSYKVIQQIIQES